MTNVFVEVDKVKVAVLMHSKNISRRIEVKHTFSFIAVSSNLSYTLPILLLIYLIFIAEQKIFHMGMKV